MPECLITGRQVGRTKQWEGKQEMKSVKLVTLLTGAAVAMAANGHAEVPAGKESLMVHVGGTMRPPMEEICKIFEKESGIKVEVNYGDSGALMTAIQTSGKGDVCILHDPFPASMEKKGMVDKSYTVALLSPMIVVKKGNPKKIGGIKDLIRADVKVGLTDATYSTAGHIVSLVFKKAGIADTMEKKDIVRARSGGEMANAVKIGTVDAAIVWDAVAFARKDSLDSIAIEMGVLPTPKVDDVTTATYGLIDMSAVKVVIMTLKGSKQLEPARRLAELAMSDRGRDIFLKMGFTAAPGTASKPAAGGAKE